MGTLNLDLLQGFVKLYGAPLYASEPIKEAGAIAPADYELVNDGTTLKYIDELGNAIYFPIRRSVLEAGFGDDRVFNIGIFEATRDAQGTDSQGNAWSVAKGQRKVFAY